MTHLLRTLVVGALAALAWVVWMRVDETILADRLQVRQLSARAETLEGELQASRSESARLAHELEAGRRRIVELDAAVAAGEARIDELSVALRHIKVDTRRARLEVLGQDQAPGGTTRVRFTELDGEGAPVGGSVETELPGKVAYIESLVIKFDDTHVEAGDAWRGASLCLFRRMFSERQSPEEGVPLDPEGVEPAGYADDDTDPADALWRRFWDYADDPAAAAAEGVRALHGEAPFVELREGRRYLVELRASGGLTIRREMP